MGITEFITENLIWIAVIIVTLIVIILFSMRENKQAIDNEVDVFFKGGTEDTFPCIVDRTSLKFTIGETEYSEPILHHPRIKFDKKRGKFVRSYKYAEGIGTVEVPPLTESDKTKLVMYLIENKVIPEEQQKLKGGTTKKVKDYTDEELIKYVKFYNFDIEQITERPISNAFVMTVNMFTSMTTSLISAVAQDLTGKGTSNLARIAWVIVGILIGFGFAWALSLKGVI